MLVCAIKVNDKGSQMRMDINKSIWFTDFCLPCCYFLLLAYLRRGRKRWIDFDLLLLAGHSWPFLFCKFPGFTHQELWHRSPLIVHWEGWPINPAVNGINMGVSTGHVFSYCSSDRRDSAWSGAQLHGQVSQHSSCWSFSTSFWGACFQRVSPLPCCEQQYAWEDWVKRGVWIPAIVGSTLGIRHWQPNSRTDAFKASFCIVVWCKEHFCGKWASWVLGQRSLE